MTDYVLGLLLRAEDGHVSEKLSSSKVKGPKRFLIGLVAVAALTLAGCAQSNTPSEYNNLTKQNFLELCTNFYYQLEGEGDSQTLTITSSTIAGEVKGLSPDICTCQYEVFANNVPINDDAAKAAGYKFINFTTLNSDLKDNPESAWSKVDPAVITGLQNCNNGSASGASTSSTTVPPSTTVAQ